MSTSAPVRTPARTPVPVRRAVPGDAPELVRLREIMLASIERLPAAAAPPAPGERSLQPPLPSWQHRAEQVLRSRLADPGGSLAAFVVDRQDGPAGLAACAVGTVEQRLPGPADPWGLVGEIFNVATEPDLRRRGYSRACMTALLRWYRECDVRKIDLRASEEGEPLYASLGFVHTTTPAMRLVR